MCSVVQALIADSLPESPLLYWLKCFINSGANSSSHEERQLQLAMRNGPSPSQDQHSLPMQLTHGAVLTAVKLAHDAVRAAASAAVTAAAAAEATEATANSATAAAAARAAATAAKAAAAVAEKAATAALVSVTDVQEKLEMVILTAMLPPHEDDASDAGSAVRAFLTGGPAAGNAVLDGAILRLRQGS